MMTLLDRIFPLKLSMRKATKKPIVDDITIHRNKSVIKYITISTKHVATG